jgi:tellurite resistance protein TerC
MHVLTALLSADFLGNPAWVWWYMGSQSGMDYYTGFLIEKSLSMDNVFVIALIFSFFAIPRQYQHRVLFWGILGVIVLRAIMIGLGATLVSQFSWVLYLFGAFLIFTGIKMWIIADHVPDIAQNPLLKFLRRHMRVTDELRGNAFWVREPDPATGKIQHFFTPLFLALVLVEFVDLIFAVDSVPAIFAITTDPFIVYTSNIFAILGLRALYFALAAMIHRFKYLKYALALVLVFIGSKIFLVGIIGKIPPAISLSVTLGLIAGGVLVSLWKTRGQAAVVEAT